MKLASALTERSDLQRRIAEISKRLTNNAKVQEGDTPAEDPAALLQELDNLLCRLEELVAKINLTNSMTVSEGETLTELLSRRDSLQQRLRILRGFLDAASCRIDRYSKAEIKILSTVPVAEIQKDVDRYAKELREMNERIQELNWTTELQ